MRAWPTGVAIQTLWARGQRSSTLSFSFSSLTSSNMPSYFQPGGRWGGRRLPIMYLQLSLLCSLACAWLWFKGLVQGRSLLETHSGIMSHPSFQSSSFYHTYYAGGSVSGMILVFYPRPNSATQSSWGLAFFKHFSLQVLVLTITVQSRHSYTHFFSEENTGSCRG